jgi:uncharacterized protein (DUF1778 family)
MRQIAGGSKTVNVTFRLTPAEKTLLEEGAVLSGARDLTTFVLTPALDRARELTQRESSTILTKDSRDRFIELMERAPAPSARLIRNLRDKRHEVVE